ncbi:MAG: hypothetical protein IIB90_18680 [Gemmatimonadetes bacterium]|nr:hypothetical protein [Gemmatimonadota bacterium]
MIQDTLQLTMLSPLPEFLDEKGKPLSLARRPESLDGQVVGLLPNWRPSAVKILEAVGELLRDRYNLKGLTQEQPAREVPSRTGALIDGLGGLLDELAGRVDVVITSTGD